MLVDSYIDVKDRLQANLVYSPEGIFKESEKLVPIYVILYVQLLVLRVINKF